MVILEGEFAVLLYHVGTERHGYYNPTTTLFCSSKDEGQKYTIEGISDYFTIMFGMNQQYNRTTYKINEFDDSSNDIEAYSPWSVEEFCNSNFPFLCGSHMMTIKLILSFVTSVSSVQSVLNDINSELVLWPSKDMKCDNGFNPLRFQVSVACYQVMCNAIELGLYKPVRDELGKWCAHLDPLDTCQSISLMLHHEVVNREGTTMVVCIELHSL